MDGQATAPDVADRVSQLTATVKKLAYHMKASVPASVEMDDLVQSGMLGLLDAARRYDGADGVGFATYATHRIRGAMLDSLRQLDWLPRSVRSDLRRVEAMIARLEQHTGRAPSEAEVAKALNMKLADYQQLLLDGRGHQILSYEDFGDGEDSFPDQHAADANTDPLTMLEEQSFRETMVRAIEALPEREKTVLALNYQEELKLRDIGEVLNVSESRICQILTQATARLRVAVKAPLQQ